MPNLAQSHVQEIASAPVGLLLTNTLMAMVDAQAAASLKTAELFKDLAYDIDPTTQKKTLRYLDLTYDRANPDFDPADNSSLPSLRHTVTMPEILMQKLSSLEISEATFDFNVNIDSMEYAKQSTSTDFKVGLSARARLGWWGNVNLSSSFSRQSKRESGHEVNRSYALAVHVKVQQAEPPAGFVLMQGLFQKAIMEAAAPLPVAAPDPDGE